MKKFYNCPLCNKQIIIQSSGFETCIDTHFFQGVDVFNNLASAYFNFGIDYKIKSVSGLLVIFDKKQSVIYLNPPGADVIIINDIISIENFNLYQILNKLETYVTFS
jgi:hypothetical protein